jgi:hypothetical protein
VQGKRSFSEGTAATLWAAVVAQRLGFGEDEALTLGKALAELNAQAKGRRLGIFKPGEEKPKKAREKERGEEFWIEICGRPVPAMNTGIRAGLSQRKEHLRCSCLFTLSIARCPGVAKPRLIFGNSEHTSRSLGGWPVSFGRTP